MSLIPYLTPDQQRLVEVELEKLSAAIAQLTQVPLPRASDESEQLVMAIAEWRGKFNSLSGDCFSLMEGIRRCWSLNYPPASPAPVRRPVVTSSRPATIDDLII